ncbi:MAG: hypothetical protein WCC64_01110 [Aliidongia sp.]
MNIHAQQLYTDLGQLADGGATEIGKPLAEVYNKLLEEARKASPTDEMVGTLKPVAPATKPRELQALTGQLKLALGNT